MFPTPKQSPLLRSLEHPLNPPQSPLEPGLFLKRCTSSADALTVEQDTLEDLAFSLDLMYLANGLGFADAGHTGSTPAELEELEAMMRAVITSANTD